MIDRLLLAALTAAMAAVLWTSDLPWRLTSQPGLLPVAEVPVAAREKLTRFLGQSGYFIHGSFTPQPVALGYSFRQISGARMPFAAWPEYGLVLYDRAAGGTRMVPLDADYLRLLEREVGRPLPRDIAFPYHRYMWGWLFVAAFIVWLVIHRRLDDRRRAAEGRL